MRLDSHPTDARKPGGLGKTLLYRDYDIQHGWCGRVGGHTLACISLIGNDRYFGERLGGMSYSPRFVIVGAVRGFYLSKS